MEPTENIANYKLGVFYFNKSDARVVVPKKDKMMGWTFNFSHLKTYLFILLAVAILWAIPYVLVSLT
jgi:uncharacterized membrane protein